MRKISMIADFYTFSELGAKFINQFFLINILS